MTFKDSMEFNYYKIGVSKDVEQRRKTLQTGISFPLRIIYKKYLEKAMSFENDIKKRFKDNNVTKYIFGKYKRAKISLPNKTEWFDLSEKEILSVKSDLNKYDFDDKIEALNNSKKNKTVKSFFTSSEVKIKKYRSKNYIKGNVYYTISLKQNKYLINLLNTNGMKKTHYNFIKSVCKKYQTNKKLTEKQYKYATLIAHIYR
jgi:hypothetical protein